MNDLRAAAQQALEALLTPSGAQACSTCQNGPENEYCCRMEMWSAITALRAALAQQAEPAAGKVVAWGVFANIDGEWQLQHPVFAGDEQGKVNSEFERASYSGPQPLEVRPLGVVTATAQQAEPPNLADPAVQKRLATQWGYVPAAQAEPVEPVAYIHRQGNYWDTSERHLTDDEKARGWTEEPLYTAPPPPQRKQAEPKPMPPEQRQRWEELAAMPQQAEPAQDIHGACPTHCCPVHGCKYMHDECPVVSGAVQPVYPRNNGCESCADEAEPLDLSDPAVQRRLAAQWGYVPAAAQAEPVAWIYQNMYTEQEYLVWKRGTGGRNWRPLYTAPPQRKPLPKHDQHCVDVPGYGLTAVRLVRAVERAHGIKE